MKQAIPLNAWIIRKVQLGDSLAEATSEWIKVNRHREKAKKREKKKLARKEAAAGKAPRVKLKPREPKPLGTLKNKVNHNVEIVTRPDGSKYKVVVEQPVDSIKPKP